MSDEASLKGRKGEKGRSDGKRERGLGLGSMACFEWNRVHSTRERRESSRNLFRESFLEGLQGDLAKDLAGKK